MTVAQDYVFAFFWQTRIGSAESNYIIVILPSVASVTEELNLALHLLYFLPCLYVCEHSNLYGNLNHFTM